MSGPLEGLERYRILGVPVTVLDMERALAAVDDTLAAGRGGYVCIRDAHGVMAARCDPHLQQIHEDALMVTPDGMPLVWLGQAYGHTGVRRVCGPDFMKELCRHSVARGYRHYFHGGTPDTVAQLVERLGAAFPGLSVAGFESPPFRDLTEAPDPETAARISATRPQIVWVGLGSPKQEYWMRANAPLIPGSILIGVGAAFNFHAGTVRRAPPWMQRSGLEWFYRLCQEPRRTWRRYLVMAPQFAVAALAEYAMHARRRPTQS